MQELASRECGQPCHPAPSTSLREAAARTPATRIDALRLADDLLRRFVLDPSAFAGATAAESAAIGRPRREGIDHRPAAAMVLARLRRR
jgi:hypothetical protein